MKLSGSQILIECLKEQNVDTVFGYPGGAVIEIYDEIYKASDYIKHILTAHEQAAAHAADAYARVSGKVGVCIATSGPGATNLVTGIATAYMDSIPMIAITGNVGVPLLGKDSFQEIDIAGVTRSITKHNYIVKRVEDLADTIREAFLIAKSGRPGPVLIDIPKDVTIKTTDFEPLQNINDFFSNSVIEYDFFSTQDISTAAKLINESKRPFLYIGGGVIISGAEKELLDFAEKIDAPVSNSLMGAGGFPQNHPLSTGLVGMHGGVASNEGIMNCDLLIAIGARFSDRVTSSIKDFAKNAKIIHIDIDPAEIDKNVNVTLSVIGDAKVILTALNQAVEIKKHSEWVNTIENWKIKHTINHSISGLLDAKQIIESIDILTKGNAIITTEVGQHQMWAAQFYCYKEPRTFISSGGLGTMGFGTGASIGASFAAPNKKIIQIAGDGSFRMNSNELSTIHYYNLPIIIVILNNSVLGMVRQWQNLFYAQRYSQTVLDRGPDFVKLAEAYAIDGYRATTIEEFNEAFSKAVAQNKPAVIDCIIDKDDKVLPMVAPGAPTNQLIIE
ncbi:biosynthetic-type acetolactate synthase large subunit [Candidatus Epulonipiscium viviparus]|uniref:biosynthetic-type acetolactate synthase large subunit n=1 Tax=Candidatus Epulonipiscium viviparus TaxID=420336 RepID=UPI00016C08C6|nr:biosynthetic-type acetolactate synthase large subunit [Candidatus Epulopiscium viviparus]